MLKSQDWCFRQVYEHYNLGVKDASYFSSSADPKSEIADKLRSSTHSAIALPLSLARSNVPQTVTGTIRQPNTIRR